MTKPIDDLKPEISDNNLKVLLENSSEILQECVNYGTWVLKWIIEKEEKGDESLPPILFLRNLLEIIDSVSILMSHSSIEPGKILLRSALETYFYLEYLFECDTNNRSIAYLVWNTHNINITLTRFDSQSEVGKNIAAKLKNDKFISSVEAFIPKEIIENQKKNNASLLNLPLYKKVNSKYLLLRKNRGKNINWYSILDGPSNLADLAKKSSLYSFYEVIYRLWSNSVHGTDIIQGKIVPENNNAIGIMQLRYYGNGQIIFSLAFQLINQSLRLFINNKLPERKQEFQKWFENISLQYSVTIGRRNK